MGLQFTYVGFLELMSCRQIGFGLGPIPLTAIVEYGTIYGLDSEQLEDFIWLVLRLDTKYTEWNRKHHGQSK